MIIIDFITQLAASADLDWPVLPNYWRGVDQGKLTNRTYLALFEWKLGLNLPTLPVDGYPHVRPA